MAAWSISDIVGKLVGGQRYAQLRNREPPPVGARDMRRKKVAPIVTLEPPTPVEAQPVPPPVQQRRRQPIAVVADKPPLRRKAPWNF